MRPPSKEELHRLVDALPPGSMAKAGRILRIFAEGAYRYKTLRRVFRIAPVNAATGDPFLRALKSAPADDEPVTPEDEADAREGLEELANGKTISHEELRRRLLGQP